MVFIAIVNVFLAGLLAGEELAVCYGLREPLNVLSAYPQIQIRQALIKKLRILVPATFLPAVISAILLTFHNTQQNACTCRFAGLVAMLIWSLTTFMGTVPIHKQVALWNPETPPINWRTLINQWERLDQVRCWSAIIAFGFFLAAIMIQLDIV